MKGGSQSSPTLDEDISWRRTNSPLLTTQQHYERKKKHAELSDTAGNVFENAREVIHKFETLNDCFKMFGEWAVTTEVEKKMNSFREAHSAEAREEFWDLIQAELIISNQQKHMNNLLLKTNADLQGQLALARDIFTRTQTEGIETLKNVVTDSLELLKVREEEAGNWKTRHFEAREQCENLRKDMRNTQKKLEETQNKLEAVETECKGLQQAIHQAEKTVRDKEALNTRLAAELQDCKLRISKLQSDVNNRIDEIASFETDLRKAMAENDQKEKEHKQKLEKYTKNFEKLMSDELKNQKQTMEKEHRKETEQFQIMIRQLQNENKMMMTKLEDYRNYMEQISKENDFLKRNEKQIRHEALARAQRRVFSALNYESPSSDSPQQPLYHSLPRHRSRSVTFPDEYTVPERQTEQISIPVTEPIKALKQPSSSIRALKHYRQPTSQARNRPVQVLSNRT